MATVKNLVSGLANNPAIWQDGVVPIAPHCAEIINGTNVENPVGHTWTLGDASAPTVPALRATGTGGTGTFENRGTLQVYADIQQCNANWTYYAGVVEFLNTTTLLRLFVGNDHSQTSSRLTFAGTGPGANRAVFRPGAGSAGYRIQGANVGGPSTQVVGSWALIKESGSSTIPALSVGCNTSSGRLDIEHVVFDGGGRLSSPLTVRSGNLWRVRHCTWVNTQGSRSVEMITEVGTRAEDARFEDCVFDKLFKNTGPNLNLVRCLFRARIDINTTQNEITDCVLVDQSAAGNVIPTHGTPLLRGMRVRVNPADGNWHGLVLKTGATVDGMLFDGVVQDSTGDLIQTDANTTVAFVRNVLATRSAAANGSYGKLFGIASTNSSCSSITHCTHSCYAGVEGALVNVGETYAGSPGMIGELRHNISRGLSAGSGLLIARLSAGAVGNIKDAATPANITDNVVPSPYAGGAGVGPAALTAAGGDGIMFTTPPEAPLDLDPMFVDDARNLATWYRSIAGGAPDTRANDTLAAIAALATMNDDSPTAGATIVAAWRWIRAGYAPRNPRLRTGVSADNGGWIGAVPGNNLARLRAHSLL